MNDIVKAPPANDNTSAEKQKPISRKVRAAITSLVAGVDSETLPMVIYGMARRGVSPVVNAVSAFIVVAFGILILLSERLRRQ